MIKANPKTVLKEHTFIRTAGRVAGALGTVALGMTVGGVAGAAVGYSVAVGAGVSAGAGALAGGSLGAVGGGYVHHEINNKIGEKDQIIAEQNISIAEEATKLKNIQIDFENTKAKLVHSEQARAKAEAERDDFHSRLTATELRLKEINKELKESKVERVLVRRITDATIKSRDDEIRVLKEEMKLVMAWYNKSQANHQSTSTVAEQGPLDHSNQVLKQSSSGYSEQKLAAMGHEESTSGLATSTLTNQSLFSSQKNNMESFCSDSQDFMENPQEIDYDLVSIK